jgi:hypothetical protein
MTDHDEKRTLSDVEHVTESNRMAQDQVEYDSYLRQNIEELR